MGAAIRSLFIPGWGQAYSNNKLEKVKTIINEYGYLYYEKSIKLNPKNPQTYNNLGVVFIILGQKKLATTYFKKAISVSENFTTAYYNLSISENFSSKNSDLLKMESIYLKNKIENKSIT